MVYKLAVICPYLHLSLQTVISFCSTGSARLWSINYHMNLGLKVMAWFYILETEGTDVIN
jgi:hypothetical protein